MGEAAYGLKGWTNRLPEGLVRRLQPRFGDAPRWNPGRVVLAISRRAYLRTAVRKEGFCCSIYGPWLKSRFDDRTFRFAMCGTYGFYYSDFLRKPREGNFRFIDVGANIGLYSLIASENPRCTAVDSFEPNARTLDYLRSNLDRNRAEASVHPHAISTRTGTQVLREPAGHSGAATLEGGVGDVASESEVTLVDAAYLRDKFGSSNERLVLKIDVEGHEREVLGAFRVAELLENTSSVWIEVASDTESEARSLLESAGFRATHAEGSAGRWDLLFERVSG